MRFTLLQQSWGNHIEVSQAVYLYLFLSVYACILCWFGNELSEQVRKIGVSYLMTRSGYRTASNLINEYFPRLKV
jgi:hypothetical protein